MGTFGAFVGVLGGSGSGLDGTLESELVGDEAVSEHAGLYGYRSGCWLRGVAHI